MAPIVRSNHPPNHSRDIGAHVNGYQPHQQDDEPQKAILDAVSQVLQDRRDAAQTARESRHNRRVGCNALSQNTALRQIAIHWALRFPRIAVTLPRFNGVAAAIPSSSRRETVTSTNLLQARD